MTAKGVWTWFRPGDVDEQYFETVLARYDASKLLAGVGARAEVDARVDQLRSQPISNAATLELELLRIGASSVEELLQEIPELRRRWSALGGKPLSSTASSHANRDSFVAEASFLMTEISREYDLRIAFGMVKGWQTWRMAIIFIAWVLAAIAVAYLKVSASVFAEAIILGLLGGYVSCFLRIYQMPAGADTNLAVQSLRYYSANLIAKPLLGALFAVVLYLLFMSHLMTSPLFPAISIGAADTPISFQDYFFGTVMATSVEFAKLLVWCFIAGFAERLVPDIVGRLTTKAISDAAKKSGNDS